MKETILLGDRVLIRPDKVDEKFENTDIVKTPQMLAEEKPNTGEITQVSTQIKKPIVKVGDKVLFNKHAGIDVEVKGEKLQLMGENQVWLITERK